MEPTEHNTSLLQPQQIILLYVVTFGFMLFFGMFATVLNNTVLLLLGESIIILPSLIYVIAQRRPFATMFRFQPVNGAILLKTLLLFVTVFIITDELDRLVTVFFPMPAEWMDALQNLVAFTSFPQTILLIFSSVILASFAEEMLFRGLTQRTLEAYRDPAMAIVFTAVLFAFAHFNPWTAIQVMLLGVVLGYVTWKSQSIYPAILIHGLNNLLSLFLMNSAPEQHAWYAGETHVRLPWIFFALLILIPAFQTFNQSCKDFEKK